MSINGKYQDGSDRRNPTLDWVVMIALVHKVICGNGTPWWVLVTLALGLMAWEAAHEFARRKPRP